MTTCSYFLGICFSTSCFNRRRRNGRSTWCAYNRSDQLTNKTPPSTTFNSTRTLLCKRGPLKTRIVVVTVTEALVLHPQQTAHHIVNRILVKCFQIKTKRFRRMQQFQLNWYKRKLQISNTVASTMMTITTVTKNFTSFYYFWHTKKAPPISRKISMKNF